MTWTYCEKTDVWTRSDGVTITAEQVFSLPPFGRDLLLEVLSSLADRPAS